MQDRITSSFLNPFAIQYISLILIIITFVAGVFTAERASSGSTHSEGKEIEINLDPGRVIRAEGTSTEVGEVYLQDFFLNARASFDSRQNAGLEFLLLNHDLEAEIEISAGPGNSSGKEGDLEPLMLAMLRSRVLFKHFDEQGVPLSALNIYVRENTEREPEDLSVRVRHYREQ